MKKVKMRMIKKMMKRRILHKKMMIVKVRRVLTMKNRKRMMKVSLMIQKESEDREQRKG